MMMLKDPCGGWAGMARARDKSSVYPELLQRPACKLPIKVLGCVSEGGEDKEFAVAGI